MLSLLSLLYGVLVLLAMVSTGIWVSGKVRQGARRLMWCGIVLLALTQFSGLFTTALIGTRMPALGYSFLGLVNVALTVSGTVLLLFAIVRAAREGGPSGDSVPGQPQYPIQHGSNQQFGGQPYGSNQPFMGNQPHGNSQPYDGSNQPYGQPPSNQPGAGTDQQRPR